jgi:hypothetical protein
MSFKLAENCGNLFRNDRKREGERDPDFKGEIDVAGEVFWLNAWRKEGKNGAYLSLSIKRKEGPRPGQPAMVATRDDPFSNF